MHQRCNIEKYGYAEHWKSCFYILHDLLDTRYIRFSFRKLTHTIHIFFFGSNNENFQSQKFIFLFYFILFFILFSQNIHRGYMLDPPCQGGSNEYPQCMFISKNIKKIGIPLHIPVLLYKSGV